MGDPIVIPEDQFLESVTYDKDNKWLVFNFHTTEGNTETHIPVDDFVKTYKSGKGIVVNEDGTIDFNCGLESTSPKYVDINNSYFGISTFIKYERSNLSYADLISYYDNSYFIFNDDTKILSLNTSMFVQVKDVYTKEEIDIKLNKLNTKIGQLETLIDKINGETV